jgi:hypothetical protein
MNNLVPNDTIINNQLQNLFINRIIRGGFSNGYNRKKI